MTERRAVLIRHAKTEPTARSDAERELTRRGRADAAAVGRWLAGQALQPDRVVVSLARRARQTWALAAEALPAAAPPRVDERIYAEALDGLLAVLRETPEETTTVCVVGHNPSIAALAAALDDGAGDATARAALTAGYPTAGTAVFTVTAPWSELSAGAGTLQAFSVARG